MPKFPIDDREAAYSDGERFAWVRMLAECLRALGYDSPEAARATWIVERERAVSTLRSACADVGDNDWPNELNLCDVIDKHLMRYWPEGDE